MASNLLRLTTILVLALLQTAPADAQTSAEPEIFGSWQRTCLDGASCKLAQANADPKTNDIRMRTEISMVSDNGILMSVIVPDSVLLTEGPWLTVDGVFVGELNYVRCSNGCLARILFTYQQFRLVSGGNKGVIAVTAGGERVGLVISMNGLEDGLILSD